QTFEPVGNEQVEPLALWHGWSLELGLSGIIVARGIVLFIAARLIGQPQQNVPTWIDSPRICALALARFDAVPVWITGRVRRGDPAYFLAATVIILSAFATIRARRRFWAVLLVSTTGYGTAVIFALQGSPDLALTQVLVESVLTVAMVLGLRVLPPRIPDMERKDDSKWARAILAIGFGLTMMWVAATVMASRVADPISLQMPELSYSEGGGSNIVNVTLVDMRAWDTFGEITVLAAAATGVASLVFIAERERRRHSLTEVAAGSVGRYNVADSAMDD